MILLMDYPLIYIMVLWSTVINLLEVIPTKNISQDCCLFDYKAK